MCGVGHMINGHRLAEALHMRRVNRIAVIAVFASLSVGLHPAHAQEEEAKPARVADPAAMKAFTDMVKSYRERPALGVKSSVKIEVAQDGVAAKPSEAKGEFIFGSSRSAVVKMRGFTCYLSKGTISAVREGTDHSYYTASDDESPYYALFNAFVDMPFPELAIELGEDSMDDVLLQFHPKAPGLQPVSVANEEKDGNTIEHLKLAGDNETMDLIIDPKTQLIQTIELKMTGGEFAQQGSTVVYKHTYEYETHDKPLDPSTFTLDPGQRQRVDLMAALMPRPTPRDPGAVAADGGEAHVEHPLVGKPAPSFTLATIDEKSVDLEKLRGRVVVLDFWASWCPPCMQALPMLHQVAKWAADEQLPVTVITINTMEIRDPNAKPEDRLASAKATWTKKSFTLPAAMDYDDAVANRYGVNGIPVGVIIRADGIVHAVHVGYGGNYMQMMKDDIQAAIKAVEK